MAMSGYSLDFDDVLRIGADAGVLDNVRSAFDNAMSETVQFFGDYATSAVENREIAAGAGVEA